jgi:nucleoside-diphosphate-sugar epimerase
MSLLIFGGNGFVGSAAARWALSQGVKVTCVSRSGKPRVQEAWQTQVNYVRGDVFEPASYRQHLAQAAAVVHSIGVLLDSRTPLNLFQVYQGSYEQMNRDSALTLLGEMASMPKPFVYVSAERGMFFSPRYLSTKREVEAFLANQNTVPYAVVRPGFMYRENTALKPIASVLDVLHAAEGVMGDLGKSILPTKSLHVDVVGKVIVLAAFRPELNKRTLDVKDIEHEAAGRNSLV